MKCPNCGAELPDTALFCGRCGHKIERQRGEYNQSFNSGVSDKDETQAWQAPGTSQNAQDGSPGYDQGQKYDRAAPGSGAGQDRQQRQGYYGNGQGDDRRASGNGWAPDRDDQRYISPYDHTSEYSREEISDNKVVCMVLYLLGTLGLFIGLLADHGARGKRYKTTYIGFNIRQALKLEVFQILANIAAVILGVIIALISMIGSAAAYSSDNYYDDSLLNFLNGMGTAITVPLLIMLVIAVIVFIVRIICFVHVCKGRAVEAPIVRDMKFMR